MAGKPHWERDGMAWACAAYPGWAVRDTGRRGRRDRYVIIRPDGTTDGTWHRAYMDVRKPGLNHALEAATVRAAALTDYRRKNPARVSGQKGPSASRPL